MSKNFTKEWYEALQQCKNKKERFALYGRAINGEFGNYYLFVEKNTV